MYMLAAAFAAAAVTPASAQPESMPPPQALKTGRPGYSVESRPVGADDWARELVTSLNDLQQQIASKIPGQRGQELYQQARTALDEAVRVREAIQQGAKPEALQRRLAQLNRVLQPLLDAVGQEVRSVKQTAGRITSIERRLEAAISPQARDPQAVMRQAHKLAVQSQRLQEGAWHVAQENPVFQPLAEDVEAFARTAAEYHFLSQDPDASWEDLLSGFHKVHLAWLQMVTRMEAWSPRQIPALYGQVTYLAPTYDRLSRHLHRETAMFTPSDISSSARPSVPAVP
jgi:hypothetical protein